MRERSAQYGVNARHLELSACSSARDAVCHIKIMRWLLAALHCGYRLKFQNAVQKLSYTTHMAVAHFSVVPGLEDDGRTDIQTSPLPVLVRSLDL